MTGYPFSDIEKKWQAYWEKDKTFRAAEDPKVPREKRKYVLDMFPYPSAAGLHVGHPEGYIATDIYCRYLRMKGFNVLHPMGFDSFGLPAENYAIKTGTHPRVSTEQNIARFTSQIKSLGFSYDWDRLISTCEPEYYRWTQWIFLKLWEKGLAYEAEVPINWCPSCMTGLANEEVKDGLCDRCGTPVTRRNLRQWILKITAYAERLLADLDMLDWSESLKLMQTNWIGRSEGANVRFALEKGGGDIEVYTTRPDTLFGATYMVLAPEHPLVARITTRAQKGAVEDYIEAAAMKSDLERTELAKDKTGVFTGAFAINPVNGKKIPVWISDYILDLLRHRGHHGRSRRTTSGTSSSRRSSAFPIIQVVSKDGDQVRADATPSPMDGVAVNSGEFDGLPTAEFKKRIVEWLEKKGIGTQRGELQAARLDLLPAAVLGRAHPPGALPEGRHRGGPLRPAAAEASRGEDVHARPAPAKARWQPSRVGEHDLPEMRRARQSGKPTRCPSGRAPAGTTCASWTRRTTRPSPRGRRSTTGCPWTCTSAARSTRCCTSCTRASGTSSSSTSALVNTREPFMRLINQGMILGEGGVKMSKSLGNVINPDDIITRLRRGHHARLRDVHGAAGGVQALVHARDRRGEALPGKDLAHGGASPDG